MGYDRYDRAVYGLACPLIAHVPAEFVAGLAPACLLVDGYNLMYQSEPMPKAVLESAGWSATTRWMPTVNATRRQIDYAKSVSIDEYFGRWVKSYHDPTATP